MLCQETKSGAIIIFSAEDLPVDSNVGNLSSNESDLGFECLAGVE